MPDPIELEMVPTNLPEDVRNLNIAHTAPDFEETFLAQQKLLDKARKLAEVTSVDDVELMARHREIRLDLVPLRTKLDRIRKAMGEDARKRVETINRMFGGWEKDSEHVEAWLKENEQFAITYEASRKAELKQARDAELREFTDPSLYNTGEMTQEQWETTLAGVMLAHQERERQAAYERQLALQLERQRQADEQRRREELEEAQRARELAHQERLKAEAKAAEEKRRADEMIRKERAQREALEEAERKRVAAEQAILLQKVEEERRMANLPEKERFIEWLNEVSAPIQTARVPVFERSEIQELLRRFRGFMSKVYEKMEEELRKI